MTEILSIRRVNGPENSKTITITAKRSENPAKGIVYCIGSLELGAQQALELREALDEVEEDVEEERKTKKAQTYRRLTLLANTITLYANTIAEYVFQGCTLLDAIDEAHCCQRLPNGITEEDEERFIETGEMTEAMQGNPLYKLPIGGR